MDTSPLPRPGIDTRARQPRSSRGAEIIKQRIKQGIYQPGQLLPSLRTLSVDLNLSLRSVQRAVQQLEREAIVESRHGVGIRVLEGAHCGSTPFILGFVQPYFSRFSMALQHYLEQALDSRSNLCIVKSTHNSPERERQEIERLIKSDINGLLIWPVDGDTNGDFLRQVTRHLPVVFVDRILEDVPGLFVVLDYEDGAHQIVRHITSQGRRSILMVCDPADISSFNQLKQGMRQACAQAHPACRLEILDYPVVKLIESAYQSNYGLADACYDQLAPLLQSGQYDTLFCPQSEFFDQVFADSDRPEILAGMCCVTLRALDGPPHSRRYQKMDIQEWILDIPGMMVHAVDLLQDATVKRSSSRGIIRIPLYPGKV